MRYSFLIFLILFDFSCSKDPQANNLCTPGIVLSCPCSSNSSGIQICNSDGVFDECQCETIDTGIEEIDSDNEDIDSDIEEFDSDIEEPDSDIEEFDSDIEEPDSDIEELDSDIEELDSDFGEFDTEEPDSDIEELDSDVEDIGDIDNPEICTFSDECNEGFFCVNESCIEQENVRCERSDKQCLSPDRIVDCDDDLNIIRWANCPSEHPCDPADNRCDTYMHCELGERMCAAIQTASECVEYEDEYTRWNHTFCTPFLEVCRDGYCVSLEE